jgi:hypothetical protein
MKTLAVATLTLVASTTLQAQQSTSDWRVIGSTSDSIMFYDANGVRKLPNGHFEAWVKTLPGQALRTARGKADKQLIGRATTKLVSGYIPPLGRYTKMDSDTLYGALIFEEIANEGGIEPVFRMLQEIDCQNRMSRILSVQVFQGDQKGSTDKTGEWEHIPPETNVSVLQMSLCQ